VNRSFRILRILPALLAMTAAAPASMIVLDESPDFCPVSPLPLLQ
jgi:hypothetical protein